MDTVRGMTFVVEVDKETGQLHLREFGNEGVEQYERVTESAEKATEATKGLDETLAATIRTLPEVILAMDLLGSEFGRSARSAALTTAKMGALQGGLVLLGSQTVVAGGLLVGLTAAVTGWAAAMGIGITQALLVERNLLRQGEATSGVVLQLGRLQDRAASVLAPLGRLVTESRAVEGALGTVEAVLIAIEFRLERMVRQVRTSSTLLAAAASIAGHSGAADVLFGVGQRDPAEPEKKPQKPPVAGPSTQDTRNLSEFGQALEFLNLHTVPDKAAQLAAYSKVLETLGGTSFGPNLGQEIARLGVELGKLPEKLANPVTLDAPSIPFLDDPGILDTVETDIDRLNATLRSLGATGVDAFQGINGQLDGLVEKIALVQELSAQGLISEDAAFAIEQFLTQAGQSLGALVSNVDKAEELTPKQEALGEASMFAANGFMQMASSAFQAASAGGDFGAAMGQALKNLAVQSASLALYNLALAAFATTVWGKKALGGDGPEKFLAAAGAFGVAAAAFGAAAAVVGTGGGGGSAGPTGQSGNSPANLPPVPDSQPEIVVILEGKFAQFVREVTVEQDKQNRRSGRVVRLG